MQKFRVDLTAITRSDHDVSRYAPRLTFTGRAEESRIGFLSVNHTRERLPIASLNLHASALITLTRDLPINKIPLNALSPFCPQGIEFQNKCRA